MVKKVAIAACLALAALASCAAHEEKAVEMEMESHDGLRFGVPEGRVVEAGDDRFELRREEILRTIDEVVIWTVPPPALPAGEVSNGNHPAPHTLVLIEGGMGGPEYALSIPKQLGGREVTVRAYIQSEDSVPAFADAWAAWESLAIDD